MAVEQLNLKPGKWLVANCGKMPSESNCQLVILAPEDQKVDLIAAGVKHAVTKHGHEDNEELHRGLEGLLEVIEVS
ncbi:MAG: DUF1059 domain-containing protein [Candidatus Saccharimonadales bacterium]|jgi:hypothetical protein